MRNEKWVYTRKRGKASSQAATVRAAVHSVNQLFRLFVDLIYGFACTWLKNGRTKWKSQWTSAETLRHHLLDVVRSSLSIDCLLPTVRILNVMAPTFCRRKPAGCTSDVTEKMEESKHCLVLNLLIFLWHIDEIPVSSFFVKPSIYQAVKVLSKFLKLMIILPVQMESDGEVVAYILFRLFPVSSYKNIIVFLTFEMTFGTR